MNRWLRVEDDCVLRDGRQVEVVVVVVDAVVCDPWVVTAKVRPQACFC